MKRVLLDGEFFAEWSGTLDELAAFSDVDVERLSVEEAPPAVPDVVTMRQARLALHGAGLLPQVNTMMEDADPAVSIEWEYAIEVRRDHPMIGAMGQGLGLSEDDIDALFVQAAAIA